MPSFSPSSIEKLLSVHPDLQTLFMEVIKNRDCTVISGLRTLQEQQALYAKGRTEDGQIVTYKDGIERRSKHQEGRAIDVVPYFKDEPHIRWDDHAAFKEFGWYVLGVADALKSRGHIGHSVQWGGNWKWRDFPHYEI